MNLIAVSAFDKIFQKWSISANSSQWNISGNHAVEQPLTPPALTTLDTTPLSNATVHPMIILLATSPNCTCVSFISEEF